MHSETRLRSSTRRRVHFDNEAQQLMAKEAWGAMKVSREGLVRFNNPTPISISVPSSPKK